MKKTMKTGKIRESRVDRIFDVIINLLALLTIAVVCYPLVYVLSASISSPGEVARGHVLLWPKEITLSAYQAIFKDEDLMRGYANTILITVLGTAINLVMTTCCAYPLSRKSFAGRSVITKFITFTMFFSAGMIPNYLLIKELGLLNEIWAMILPGTISVYNMLVMRNFFQTSIPDELIEAATIDGCGNVETLLKVVLPLSKSIIAVMLIFYMVGHWNSYFSAMMYITDEEKFPLQLVLRNLLLKSQSYDGEGVTSSGTTLDSALAYVTIQYAAIVVSSAPLLIMYPFMQKHFVKGVMVGAIKG